MTTIEEVGQSTKLTLKHVFQGHEDSIWSIIFLDDDIHVVSGSEDGTMRKWNCDTGLLVGEPWKGEGEGVLALSLSPDGKTIACGRQDGSVQRWNTDGEMLEGVWTGDSKWVRSLSWSPSGSHLASGSYDGTILIRRAESGEVEVGPIKTGQSYVRSLAYSPLGDKIASGGQNSTICIWDIKTGELVVGPITGLRQPVTSLVWSSDGTKIYSASDKFARIFDSVSGAELHRFQHDNSLYSVALSPNGNVLACVGISGIAQLWDTETQQIGQPFGDSRTRFFCVLFSRDGRYLAHAGNNNKITLWMVDEIAPELAESASATIKEPAPEEEETRTRPESTSSSYLDRDATRARPGNHEGQGSVDPYENFFRSSKNSLALALSDSDPRPPHRSLWGFFTRSRRLPLDDKPAPTKDRHKRSLFRRRARSKSLRIPITTDLTKPASVQEGGHVEESRKDIDCPVNSPPQAPKKKLNKGKQRQDFLNDVQSSHDDPSPPTEERGDQYNDFSQHHHPSPALRFRDIIIPSHRRAPGHESIPLRQHAKRSFFSQHSGSRPVTIYAARPKKLWWIAPRPVLPEAHSADKENENTNARTGQTLHSTAQSPQQIQVEARPASHPGSAQLEESAYSSTMAQPHLTAQSPQQPQAQHEAGAQHEESDFGWWGNFRLQVAYALGCIPGGAIVSVAPTGS